LVVRVQAERVGSRAARGRPDGDILAGQRPTKPRGRTGEQDRSYPESLRRRQVSVKARGQGNRAEQFKVATTTLDASLDGGQSGGRFERRWDGEVDIRPVKAAMQMDVRRCQAPELVGKEVRIPLLAYDLRRTVRAVAAAERRAAPRKISFQGANRPGRRSRRRWRRRGRRRVRGRWRRCGRRWPTSGWVTGRGAGSRGRGSGGPSRAGA
jgi:hypothetical protein